MEFSCIPENQLHFRKEIKLKGKKTVHVWALPLPWQKRARALYHLTCMEQCRACFQVLRREAAHYAGTVRPHGEFTERSRAATHSSPTQDTGSVGLRLPSSLKMLGSKVLRCAKSTFLHLVTKQNKRTSNPYAGSLGCFSNPHAPKPPSWGTARCLC